MHASWLSLLDRIQLTSWHSIPYRLHRIFNGQAECETKSWLTSVIIKPGIVVGPRSIFSDYTKCDHVNDIKRVVLVMICICMYTIQIQPIQMKHSQTHVSRLLHFCFWKKEVYEAYWPISSVRVFVSEDEEERRVKRHTCLVYSAAFLLNPGLSWRYWSAWKLAHVTISRRGKLCRTGLLQDPRMRRREDEETKGGGEMEWRVVERDKGDIQ